MIGCHGQEAHFVVDSTNLGHYSEIKKFEIVDGEEYNYDTVEMVNKAFK